MLEAVEGGKFGQEIRIEKKEIAARRTCRCEVMKKGWGENIGKRFISKVFSESHLDEMKERERKWRNRLLLIGRSCMTMFAEG